ncbi:MAG TPA: serine/threonine-protein kinase [Candidatus Aquilonibacter sp.]|nr:serine/threonine-protein kinase [Candidatus Aquilonibacter sp.]
MPPCASCGTELAQSGRFCSACGKPVSNTDDVATIDFSTPTPPRSPRTPSPSSRPPSSADYLLESRFLPGRLLAGRYRIVALLGKGGMGEVYRADDLTLGQAVALKFLPDEAARDETLLERFRNEVRIARRVSHPNVCRVYDVGEVDGHTFFTMEYIDGEDLASLLRRIGRLPQDKALDIARQLCAGLSAAHTKGVLHRDLKPANIMLDGRGQVVITDFGLAGVAEQFHGPEVRSGTPAYMAPEQLAGKEVSTRSDIYALGLVLYEVFTGKRAFSEKVVKAGRANEDRSPSRPSSVVKDIDPVVERVILRCLETEPSARPANVLSVAAALPGGDPLAAALAAGETPSPQMVAASGETAGLRPRAALACLAAVLTGLAFVVVLTIHYSAMEKMDLEKSPDVLAAKSREIIARLGYPGRPADSAYGLSYDDDFTDYVEKHDHPPRWDAVLAARPSLLQYWYRQSPDYLVAHQFHNVTITPGIVSATDPPSVVSGMIDLQLDPQGRLTYFQAVPPQDEKESGASPATAPFDWTLLFSAAGLDSAQFHPAQATWTSLADSDVRMAWTGTWPGTTRPLRVEAAAFQGKPVFFSLIGDWTKPDRMTSSENEPFVQKLSQNLGVVLMATLLVGVLFPARANYRRGRGDRQGAFRLAAVMFVLEIALWLCSSHFVFASDTFGLFVIAVSTALFVSGLTWLLYMALEPWVRRHWPRTIISWSRALSGQLRDPLVGRDILFGVILGVVWILIFQLRYIPMMHMGASPNTYSLEALMGGREALGAWLQQIPTSILGTLQFFFLLFGLRFLLRKEWIAAIVFVALFAVPRALASNYVAVELPAQAVIYAIAVLIVLRFGLVPLACAIFTVNLLGNVPFSADVSAWYMTSSILALLSVIALAGWGFYHSLGGEPLWKVEME